jgi:hypothetical protein
LLRQVLNGLEHPVTECDWAKRWPSKRLMLKIESPSIIPNRLEFSLLLRFSLLEDDIKLLAIRYDSFLFRQEASSRALRVHHISEFAAVGLFEIVPVALLHDPATLEDVHKVGGANLGKIVSDDDRRLVCAPSLDSFENKNTRRCVQRGRRFVCAQKFVNIKP